jgi:hypothetical protein
VRTHWAADIRKRPASPFQGRVERAGPRRNREPIGHSRPAKTKVRASPTRGI